MNIKHIIATVGLMLALSHSANANYFHLVISDFTIDEAAQKSPSGAFLGLGWQTFMPGSDNYLCEAYMPGKYQYSGQINSGLAGVSPIKADSQSYPVFKTNIEGIGYVMGYRQKGTSQWYPITSSEDLHQTQDNTSKLFLEVKKAFIKTVSGEIKKASNNRMDFATLDIKCSQSSAPLIMNNGLLMRSSVTVTWKSKSCEVKTKRETVDLGTHELVAVRKLSIGDNFGYAQQSMSVECPENMIVDYTIADNNNPNNIGTDIIYLENENSHPGFGVQMFEAGNSEALKLGGDKKTPGNYQYPFAKTTNKKEVIRKEFDFKYVKLSDNVKAADGNAKVTVTLVYR